ncbi:cAMP-independent regulatory protein pac2 [Pyrenophora tritici-repentis Pt-1C-BFP]|uniref:cAMP-independent regulatory protein pac2 n=2 Tax=Pyrenophora tritici-repentis TaxID=45151 RepID=A0A922NJM0_9PLEO|nr:cAMP-independent regulatory protein pac2 [Pyrenophora tritici-repentis Pt-1C-BFP]EDU41464.1 cAMP-independent regulatory protein pac2 [Pyrenophora tritici-repentis Pt-1C-BFP]KAI1517968.1 cAMP-independent regulatory protein pac2 [Pyrenophora tritici-repentis]
METYHGHVRTPNDAIILFEACRIGILPRVQRRLSEKERQQIKSGSVFVWDEREAGMRRWTDGKSWSASRVSGSFLTYREMEGKRGGSAVPAAPVAKRASGKSPDGSSNGDSEGEGPDGYRYKPDGLMKQSFSITTQSGQHLHLISYYSRSNSNNLPQPANDAQLRHIRPPKNMYPESAVNETQTVPAVTRGPMPGSPYSAPGHSMPPSSPYTRGGPVAPMYAVPVYPPTPPNGTSPLHPYYPQHPYFYPGLIYAQPQYHPQAHVYDRPPQHPHAPQAHHPMLMQHPAYAAHAAHAAHAAAQQYMAPSTRAPSTAEQAQHSHLQRASVVAPPPAPAQAIPEQGPQLPAINGAAAAAAGNPNKPPTPEPSDKSESRAPESDGPAAQRPLPTLGSLLNGDSQDKDNQTGSRSGSRSPNTATRFPRDLAPERLAKNSTAADSSALNKLNSVFVRS